jgi:AcrR family transcriptional regulator
VRSAGMTRGALYHHFRDKADLFRAVFEAAERDLTRRLAAATEAAAPADPLSALRAGASAYLDASLDPAMQRILLIDGPAVLDPADWRAIVEQHTVGLLVTALRAAMERGAIVRRDVTGLACILVGALDEAAKLIARSPDPEHTRGQTGEIIDAIIASLGPAADRL